MDVNRYNLSRWIVYLAFLCLLPLTSHGQGLEIEPNEPCDFAQDLGEPAIPYDLMGMIDPNDVDFFRVQAQAGQLLVADLVADSTALEPLIDPFLGLFDSNCNLILSDDDGGNGANARISFTVPSDGVFVLAASGCCDWSFDGSHWVWGSYILNISQAPEPSTVKGRVVDAGTQMPLPGDSWPYAGVELVKCWDGYPDCGLYDWMGYQPTSSQGEFLFEFDYTGSPLVPGIYQVHASANDYQPGSSDIFELAEGQDLDIGDIELRGPPVVVSEITPCTYVPAIGGECEYSVRVINAEPVNLKGAAWSLVNANGTGSYLSYTHFQADEPERLFLRPGESTEVEFEFDVPGTVPQGAYICADVWVGLGQHEDAYFFPLHNQSLFCVYKGIADSLTVITGTEAQTISDQMKLQALRKRSEPAR